MQIRRNFIWMSWAGLVTIANSVVIWIFLARLRDADEVGRFTIAMGLYALFYSAVSLGLLPYLIKEMARRVAQKNTIAGSSSLLLGVSGVVSALLMSAAAFVISGSYEVRMATALLSLAMLPTALIVVCDAVAISSGRAGVVAGVTSAENLVRTIVPLWLIWSGFDIIVVCGSFVVIRYAALAAYLTVLRRDLIRTRLSRVEFRSIASVTPIFAGTITLASLNWQAPVIMLGYLSSEAETATFGVASRFLIPASIIMGAYANTIQSALVTKLQDSPQNFVSYAAKLAAYPVAASLVSAIAAVALSATVLHILFGPAYAPAATIVIILALSVVPFCAVMVVARALIAADLQRIDLIANSLGVVVSIAAAALLIPSYGAVGAAIAQLSSFALMALIETFYLARGIGDISWPSRSLASPRPDLS